MYTREQFLERMDRTLSNIFGYTGTNPQVKRTLFRSTADALEHCLGDPQSHSIEPVDELAARFLPSTVKLVNFRKNQNASGVLLTTNGLVLTAYHNIRGWEDHWEELKSMGPTPENVCQEFSRQNRDYALFNHKRTQYDMNPTFYVTDPKHDLAIVKALMPYDPQPTGISLLTRELRDREPFLGSFYTEQSPETTVGIMLLESFDAPFDDGRTTPDTFVAMGYSEEGYSGSPMINLEGQLAGVLIASGLWRDHEVMISSKAKYVRPLVERAVAQLRQF